MIRSIAVAMLLAGVAVGAAATLLGARIIDARIFGVPRIDAVTLSGVGVFLVAVTVAAALRPALRAGRVDPSLCLRDEG